MMFFIMVAGWNELAGLDTIMRHLYHVDHFFLLHLDVKVGFWLVLDSPRYELHEGRRFEQWAVSCVGLTVD